MFGIPMGEFGMGAAAALSDRADGDMRWDSANAASIDGLLDTLGLGGQYAASARQVHGDAILDLKAVPMEDPDPFSRVRPEADALVTALDSVVLTVTVADCVPVYLMDPNRRVLGLAHAGRAGTIQSIAAKTAQYMCRHYGCRPGDLVAALGPSAGPCCYEVDSANVERFQAAGFPLCGERNLDLWGANRQQLVVAGLDPGRIFPAEQCTICGDRFYSFRRGDRLARNLAVFALAPR